MYCFSNLKSCKEDPLISKRLHREKRTVNSMKWKTYLYFWTSEQEESLPEVVCLCLLSCFACLLQGSINGVRRFRRRFEDVWRPSGSEGLICNAFLSIMGNFWEITIIRMNCSFLTLVRICVVLRSSSFPGKRNLVNTLKFLRKPDEFRVK